MTAALVLWLGLFLPALADDEERPDSCEPLDASRFRDLLLQLQAGIDRGNLELSEQVIATMRHELPCLDFAPRSRQWAAYLVGEAVVRFAKGEDWEPAMATALRIYPNVDRGVSSRHPLASWEPPAPLSQGPRVPSMVTVYVDGMRAEQLPPSGELHLVQRTDGRFWNTWLAEPDTPVPLGWATARVEPPPRVSSWGLVAGGIGTGWVRQEPLFTTDWVQTIGPTDRGGSYLAGQLQGAATFYSPVGVWARASGSTWGASPGLDACVAGIWTWHDLLLGAGAGTTSVEAMQGLTEETLVAEDSPEDLETRRIYLPRYLLGTMQLRGGTKLRYHLSILLGSGAAVNRALLEAAVGLPASEDQIGRWRVGLTLENTSGLMVEQQRPANRMQVGSTRTTITFGRAFGEY